MLAAPVRTLALTIALAGCPAGSTPEQPAGAAPAAGVIPPPAVDSMPSSQQTGTRILSAIISGFTGPEELVVRDRGAWQAAWSRLHAGMGAPALPEIDFTREMVVVLALGERSSGGYQVRFDGIAPAGSGAVVRYTATEPGPNCMTTQQITTPVDVVRVPRAAGTVRFEPRTVRKDC